MLISASHMIILLLLVDLSLQTCHNWSPWSPSDCQKDSQQMSRRNCTSTNSRNELYTSKTRLCLRIVPETTTSTPTSSTAPLTFTTSTTVPRFASSTTPSPPSTSSTATRSASSTTTLPTATRSASSTTTLPTATRSASSTSPPAISTTSSPLFKLIDVSSQYGVNYEGLLKAMQEAHSHLQQFPHAEVILHISSGLYKIPKLKHKSLIDFTGPQPGKAGRLILEGEGVEKTVLEVDPSNQILRGLEIHRLTVRNIQFRRSRPLSSQGIVKEVGKGFVVLDLEKGFPFISSFFDNSTNKFDRGKYLRKYVKKDGDCQIVEDWPSQVAWTSYTQLEQRLVMLHLKNRRKVPSYKPGDLLGVKGKCCGEGKSAYWFCGGQDVVFQNVKFHRQSRGVVRCGVNNVRFTNITILRENKGWCLSTPDGGPQIGQPRDPVIRNVIVDNLVAENTGDDAVAFFNVEEGGVIRNSKITNSFARGILLYKSKTTSLLNNVVQRCPVLHKNKIG